MLLNIDLNIVVRRKISILLDKLASTPIFVAGKYIYIYIMQSTFILDTPPIRVIKILCRYFEETFQHIFCENVSVYVQ